MHLVLSFTMLLATGNPPDVATLRWSSPDNSRPMSFAEWRSEVRPREWRARTLLAPTSFDNRVNFFVEETLVSALQQSLDTLAADLARETTGVAIFSVSGTSPESLKALLASEYQTGMSSAVLVGNLPIAWFQLIDDWNSNGRRDSLDGDVYEEFPCDLFYMDLDGTWEDNLVRLDTLDSLVPGSDSIYDLHAGTITPEIAVSRLPAAKIGNAATLLTQYFDKSHRYRNRQLGVTDRALVYIDDDWIPNSAEWYNDVGMLYPDRVFIWDAETTRIADYSPRIDSAAYQWIALMSHSWPGGHGMKYNNGQTWDWFYATSIPSLDPHANFYNLFACSNVRFIESGYCGGRYVFQTSTGLSAIGSAKTGSMLEFGDFYGPLGSGEPVGEAFRQWFEAQLGNGCANWERSWYYGMCLIADAALKPRVPVSGQSESAVAQPRTDVALQVTPNPFAGSVRLTPARTSPHAIRIFDNSGRLVRVLAVQSSASSHQSTLSMVWDGRGGRGEVLPVGVYFVETKEPGSRAKVVKLN